ncbi:MAG: helix-hairpin-helix domain-containing protein [Nitrospirota bacterium]|nr:helix-hairpin-helix domain-containing protein [Nitrospirota bacterium]
MKFTFKPLSTLMLALCLSLGLFLPITGAMAAIKTDLNTATLEQLEAVKGIGHDTAQNILDYKKEHGNFGTMNDLEAVSGVGKVRLEALNEAFMVESSKKGEK